MAVAWRRVAKFTRGAGIRTIRDAIEAYQQAVQLYPNHPTGRALLATALSEGSEHEARGP